MENKSYEIAIDPRLEVEAQAERQALAANWADNPWRGAAKRLEAAQKAARDQEKTLNAEAERREGEGLKEALVAHRSICDRINAYAREIDAMQGAADSEAAHHNRQYVGWLRIYGAEYRLDTISTMALGPNQAPPVHELRDGHYLKEVGPEMAERMRVESERDRNVIVTSQLRNNVENERLRLEVNFPVLAYCREEAVAA